MGKLLPQGTSSGNGLSNALANANGGARANTGGPLSHKTLASAS